MSFNIHDPYCRVKDIKNRQSNRDNSFIATLFIGDQVIAEIPYYIANIALRVKPRQES